MDHSATSLDAIKRLIALKVEMQLAIRALNMAEDRWLSRDGNGVVARAMDAQKHIEQAARMIREAGFNISKSEEHNA